MGSKYLAQILLYFGSEWYSVLVSEDSYVRVRVARSIRVDLSRRPWRLPGIYSEYISTKILTLILVRIYITININSGAQQHQWGQKNLQRRYWQKPERTVKVRAANDPQRSNTTSGELQQQYYYSRSSTYSTRPTDPPNQGPTMYSSSAAGT